MGREKEQRDGKEKGGKDRERRKWRKWNQGKEGEDSVYMGVNFISYIGNLRE